MCDMTHSWHMTYSRHDSFVIDMWHLLIREMPHSWHIHTCVIDFFGVISDMTRDMTRDMTHLWHTNHSWHTTHSRHGSFVTWLICVSSTHSRLIDDKWFMWASAHVTHISHITNKSCHEWSMRHEWVMSQMSHATKDSCGHDSFVVFFTCVTLNWLVCGRVLTHSWDILTCGVYYDVYDDN